MNLPNPDEPFIDFLLFPKSGVPTKVMIPSHEIGRDLHQRCTQSFVCAANEALLLVDIVTLIATGKQTGATGDVIGIGVVSNGSHFASEVRGRHDVDSRNH